MNIQRVININPIEPDWLSFRVPMGIETRLDVTFLDINRNRVDVDLAAQLQLQARSGTTSTYYSLASTDMVNGKARAVIPADMLNDINGWRLRITGTVDSEPRLLAYGEVVPIPAAGPEAMPLDTIDNIPLAFNRDEDVLVTVDVFSDDGSTDYDLAATGTSVTAYVFDVRGGGVLVPFSVAVIDANTVQLSLTALQVNNLPDTCWWELYASTGGGLTTLCQGDVTVTGVVKPPFADVIANYAYTKQATLVAPASGQVIHCDNALDIIRIHQFDSDAVDRAVTLDQLTVGDTIQVGVTVWSITAIYKPALDWYGVNISPASQAAVSGVTAVTFHRP